MVEHKTNVGRSVGSALTERSLTQQSLAQRMGQSPTYTNHILRGYRHASPQWVDLIAAALELTPEERKRLHQAAAKDHGFKI